MLEKWLKKGGFAQCPNKECKYKHVLETPAPAETQDPQPAVV